MKLKKAILFLITATVITTLFTGATLRAEQVVKQATVSEAGTVFAALAAPVQVAVSTQVTHAAEKHTPALQTGSMKYGHSYELNDNTDYWPVEAFHTATDAAPVENVSSGIAQSGTDSMTCLGSYSVVGYDACVRCCGKTDGITASGTSASVGRTCASNDFPFGTVLYIEGIGYRTVEDRGGLKPGVIDVFCSDHAACNAITGPHTVYLVG